MKTAPGIIGEMAQFLESGGLVPQSVVDAGPRIKRHLPGENLTLGTGQACVEYQAVGPDVLGLDEDDLERAPIVRSLVYATLGLVAAVWASEPTAEIADAINLIEAWDNTVARASRGGVLFRTWWWRYVETGEAARGTLDFFRSFLPGPHSLPPGAMRITRLVGSVVQ